MSIELRCLPRPGGLMDQDAKLMQLLHVVVVAQAELQSKKAGTPPQPVRG